MKINPWFRCECGKLHVGTFVGPMTKCKCGANLYKQMHIRSTNARGGLE